MGERSGSWCGCLVLYSAFQRLYQASRHIEQASRYFASRSSFPLIHLALLVVFFSVRGSPLPCGLSVHFYVPLRNPLLLAIRFFVRGVPLPRIGPFVGGRPVLAAVGGRPMAGILARKSFFDFLHVGGMYPVEALFIGLYH